MSRIVDFVIALCYRAMKTHAVFPVTELKAEVFLLSV